MTNSKDLLHDFVNRIQISEDKSEVEGIAFLALEEIYGLTRTEILLNKVMNISAETVSLTDEYINRINRYEPIQYILGYAFFLGRKFIVNKDVLIPRPETEELVLLALEHLSKKENARILDIATGSGCIPISLSLDAKNADVFATDISTQALSVADQNNSRLKSRVKFIAHNILTEDIPFPELDLITSNPPYIATSERYDMQKQVIEHEPHLALFVPDNDPLMFYRAISTKSYAALSPGGMLAMEINHRFGAAVLELFNRACFKDLRLLKDLSGKNRFVTGIKL
jgi:release factor glutamine methyltransferase